MDHLTNWQITKAILVVAYWVFVIAFICALYGFVIQPSVILIKAGLKATPQEQESLSGTEKDRRFPGGSAAKDEYHTIGLPSGATVKSSKLYKIALHFSDNSATKELADDLFKIDQEMQSLEESNKSLREENRKIQESCGQQWDSSTEKWLPIRK